MISKAIGVIALCLTLTGCGKYTFEDIYRYPCQDPANWETADCQPPACTASSSCPANLITLDGTPVSPEQMQSMIDDIKATEAAITNMNPVVPEETPTEETPLYEEVK